MARITNAVRNMRKRRIATLVRQNLTVVEIRDACEKQFGWRIPRRTLERMLHEIAQEHHDALSREHTDHVAMALARYNDLFQQASAKGDRREARLIEKDIVALMGLQAPQKRIIQGGGDGSPPVRLEVVQALRQMSQEERDEYRRMMARIDELGGPRDKPAVLEIGPPSDEEVGDS